MARHLIFLCAALTLAAAAGCGNKGPLYLPQQDAAATPATAAGREEPEEEQEP